MEDGDTGFGQVVRIGFRFTGWVRSLCEDEYYCCSCTTNDERREDEGPVAVAQFGREWQQDGRNECQDEATHDQELGSTNRCDTATVDHEGTSDDTKGQAGLNQMS